MTDGYGRSRPALRLAVRGLAATALVSALAFAWPQPALAAITSPDADGVAAALAAPGTTVTGASWVSVPGGTPDGVSSTAMAGFPTAGSTFAILTNGNVDDADKAPPSTGAGTTTDLHGANVRGDTDFDVSILKVNFTVPTGMNCVRFDFRFLSEEFPLFVNQKFNDAFIAELDTSDWKTVGSTITAPNNFAFDPSNKPISVNAIGSTTMTAGPLDTTYNGATPVLSAAHTVTVGAHSLYLSIFDQGDHRLDSAVFVDNLQVGQANEGQCVQGATPKGVGLTLAPATATKTVGSAHTVTATVTGGPLTATAASTTPGKVLFTVTGAHSITGASPTNSSGVATYTYTGTKVGRDVVTGCYDANANGACDTSETTASVAVTWQAAPPPPAAPIELPRTGLPTGTIAAVGAFAVLGGVAILFVLRRRRPAQTPPPSATL